MEDVPRTLELTRGDLLQVGPIKHLNTLRLLPLGKNGRQKLLVGDDSGSIYGYEFKRGEPQIQFTTKVFENPVSCIALGGSDPLRRDKIFISCDQTVKGLTKKGKEFFTMSSSLTEPIQSIHIENTMIWTSCESILNTYDDGKDMDFFMTRDIINALCIDQILQEEAFEAILGCQDNHLRFVRGSDLELEIPTIAPVTCLVTSRKTTVDQQPPYIVYGTEGGHMHLLQFGFSTKYTYEEVWTIPDSKQSKSPITSIKLYDLTADQKTDIIIAREDGRVEVYTQPRRDSQSPDGDMMILTKNSLMNNKPSLTFCCDVGERIQSLDCGRVNSEHYNEIIIATFSGKIISFTTEQLNKTTAGGEQGYLSPLSLKSSSDKEKITEMNENRIKALHRDIDDLRSRVEKENRNLQALRKAAGPVSPGSQGKGVASGSEFSSSEKFSLSHEAAVYNMSIEIQSPLDVVIIRSPIKLELVEDLNSNTSLASTTPQHMLETLSTQDHPCAFVAAVRCQDNEKRMKLQLRPYEGDHGEILVTIVASTMPKAAKVVKFAVKPLSLHARVHSVTEEQREGCTCSIAFTGSFNMNTCIEWLQAIVPEVPPNLSEDSGEETLLFTNTFTGHISIVTLCRNRIEISSQSASTVAIFKAGITRLANFRRVQLEEVSSLSKESIPLFLSLIESKLSYQLDLKRRNDMVGAIREIVISENGADNKSINWLSAEYKSIFENAENIAREYTNRQKLLRYIYSVIVSLHTDWHRLQGRVDEVNVQLVRKTIAQANMPMLAKVILGEPESDDPGSRGGDRRRNSGKAMDGYDEEEEGHYYHS